MMSDRRPHDNWYRSSPVERTRVGQQKVEDIQRQINTLEHQQKDRTNLLNRLNRLQEVEKGKKELQDKVLERNSRNNSPVASSRFLQSELDRLYGRDSELERARDSAPERNTLEKVIQHRTKEFSAKQQEAALTAKYLDKERKKLQEARQRVHEQRQLLQGYNDGKNAFAFHNDKVYLPYEPYHVFENKEERIRNSSLLPIPVPKYPEPVRPKIQIKFVPLPLEEDLDYWQRYNEEMIEEEQDADETLQAFLNLTARHKNPKKVKKIRYVPRCLSDDVDLAIADRIYKRRKLPMKVGFAMTDFKDSYTLPTLYEKYRSVDKRSHDYWKENMNYGAKSLPDRNYKSTRRRRGILNLPLDFKGRKKPGEKLKVSFVPMQVPKRKYWKQKTL